VILLSYFGDDFTGSTDVLEALTASGVETVLFTEPPSEEDLARFPRVRAFGVAGNSRTMSPEQMDAVLPGVFESLHARGPAIVHYKVCSTFDSSPAIGNIGRAIKTASCHWSSALRVCSDSASSATSSPVPASTAPSIASTVTRR
jgi:uncharacterized protein YgbK (DUF1537 family)